MPKLSPFARKNDHATLAPVPLTDEEVRLLVTALELLQTTQGKERDALEVSPRTVHGSNTVAIAEKGDASEEERLRTTALYQHLMAEAQHRRRCRAGRLRLAETRLPRYPAA